LKIAKKTLIYKSNPEFPFSEEELKEPFGFLWLLDENLSALKTLKDYKKEEKIKVLGGYFRGKNFPLEILELVDLPSREELIPNLFSLFLCRFKD
jgi:ribosomal protein L10